LSKKLIYIFFLLFFSLIEPQLSYAGGDTPCSVVNNAITDNPSSGWSTDCATQPTIQRVIFLKAALCKATSLAFPTTSSAIDTSSCTTIWQNSAGESVDIKLGTDVTLVGNDGITIPDAGTYPILYLEIKPYIGVSVSKKFAQPMRDTSGNVAGGGRVFCRSLELQIYNYKNTTPTASLCSSAEGVPGVTTTYFNSLGDQGGIPDPTYVDGNLKAALVTSARKLIPAPTLNTAGTEDRIVAWFAQDTKVNSNTTGFSVGFGNTLGSSIELENLWVKSFGAGPFKINITPN